MGVSGYGSSAFFPSSRRRTERRAPLVPPVSFSASTMPTERTSSQGRMPPERWDVGTLGGPTISAMEAPTLETQGTPDLVGGILGFIGKAAEWGISLPNTISKPLFGGEKGFVDVTAEALDKTPIGDVARGLNTVFDTSSRMVGVAGNSYDMMLLRQTAKLPETAVLPQDLDFGADPIGAAVTTLAQAALTPMVLANLDKAVNRQGMTVGQFRSLMRHRGMTAEQLQGVMDGTLGAYDPSLGSVRMFDDGGPVGTALDMGTRLAFDPLNLAFGAGGAAMRAVGVVTHGIGLENAAKAVRIWDAATTKPARETATLLATGSKTLAEGGTVSPTMRGLARYAQLSRTGAIRYTQASIGIGATAAAGDAILTPLVTAEKDENGWAHQAKSFFSDVLNDRPLSESSAFLVLSGVGIPIFPAVGQVVGGARTAYRSYSTNLARGADIALGRGLIREFGRDTADGLVGWAARNMALNSLRNRPSFKNLFVGVDGGAPSLAQISAVRAGLAAYVNDEMQLMIADGRISARTIADEIKRYDQYAVAEGAPLATPRPYNARRAVETWARDYQPLQNRFGEILDAHGMFYGRSTSTTTEILDFVMDDMAAHAGATARTNALIDAWIKGGTLDQKIKRLEAAAPEIHKEIMPEGTTYIAKNGRKRKRPAPLAARRAAFLREFEAAGAAKGGPDVAFPTVSRDYIRTMLDRNAGIQQVDVRMDRTTTLHEPRGIDFSRMSLPDAPAEMPYAAARARLMVMREGGLMPDARETFHEVAAAEKAADVDVMPPEATPESFVEMADAAQGPEQEAWLAAKRERSEAAYAEGEGYGLPGEAPGLRERLDDVNARMRRADEDIAAAEAKDRKTRNRNPEWMPPSPAKAKTMKAVSDAYTAKNNVYEEWRVLQRELEGRPFTYDELIERIRGLEDETGNVLPGMKPAHDFLNGEIEKLNAAKGQGGRVDEATIQRIMSGEITGGPVNAATHRPPSPEYGARMDDVTTMLPADYYDPKVRMQYYGTGFPEADAESFRVLDQVRGNPDAIVTLYRAVDTDQMTINPGDWVTPSRAYAEAHLAGPMQGKGKIITIRSRAGDVWGNGDSVNEWGYHGTAEARPETPSARMATEGELFDVGGTTGDWHPYESPWTQRDLRSSPTVPEPPAPDKYPYPPTAYAVSTEKITSAQDISEILDEMADIPGVNSLQFRDAIHKGVSFRGLSERRSRMTPARLTEIIHQLAWEETHGQPVDPRRVAQLMQAPKPLPLEASGLNWDKSILQAYDDGIFTEHDLRDAAPAQRVAEQEFGGRYAVKIRPKDALLYSEVSAPLPEGYLKRSTLQGLIFENPIALGLERMTHAVLSPVANTEIAQFARLAWESELVGKYNARPEELKRFQATLAERLAEKTLNRTGMLMYRGILSLPIGEIKAIAEKTLDKETLRKIDTEGDSIDRLLDRGANRFIRNMHERTLNPSGKGSLAAAESFLAGASEKIYRSWQASIPGGIVRNISKTYYFLFRFALDPRWWLMNAPETEWLATAQYGTYASRMTGAQKQLPGVAHKQLEAGRPVRPDEMTVHGEFLISQDSGTTMHVRHRLGYQSRILEGDGGNYQGLLRKNIDQYINDIVPTTLDDLAKADPTIKMLAERFGDDPRTWSNQLYDMLYQYDTVGVKNAVRGAAKKLSKEEKAAAAAGKITEEEHLANIKVEMDPRWNAMIDQLAETNRRTFDDVTNLLAGNMNRSNAERVLNSYWLYWPLSYQIKATRWLLRTMMKDSALGPNASGAVRIEEIRQTHIERMKADEEYARIFEQNPTLWFTAQMLVPVTPWDIGVSLSRLPRYLGAWAGIFPEYETVPPGDIVSASQQMTKLGPFYTLDLLRRIQTEAQRQ